MVSGFKLNHAYSLHWQWCIHVIIAALRKEEHVAEAFK